jgi:DNA helicase II / ATP-dependent DNA helicase PcrA
MIYSQKQIDIRDVWINSVSNILINAVAGSGKSSLLLWLLEQTQGKVLLLAFNKSIKEELEEKIKNKNLRNGKVMTLHSLGLSIIHNANIRTKIDKSKNFYLIKKLQNSNTRIFKSLAWKEQIRLSFMIMEMNDVSRMYLIEDFKELKKEFIKLGKIWNENLHLEILWNEFLEIRNETYVGRFIEIDYLDMLFAPVKLNLNTILDPDYIFIDEAQDLSLLQHQLFNKLLSLPSVKKFIAVGDKNQSIYEFSGASSKSFDLFKEVPNTIEMPLDICYRCGSNIIQEANKVYDIMLPFKEGGKVEKISDFKLIKDKSMVICRNTTPLLELYFQLLSINKSVYIKGEEILSTLIKFLKPYESYPVLGAVNAMEEELITLSNKTEEEYKIQYYILKENLSNFKILVKNFCNNTDTVNYLLNRLKAVFINQQEAITLCTIHKSKGLEADVVYILNENLIPSIHAITEEQLKQEYNLKYVARTRAKEELYYLNL